MDRRNLGVLLQIEIYSAKVFMEDFISEEALVN